uniref:Uncharacterized protein n=1 Tax=Anopheles minimus TaxID=112268 RepID=A0A182WNJ8_9DIPT
MKLETVSDSSNMDPFETVSLFFKNTKCEVKMAMSIKIT